MGGSGVEILEFRTVAGLAGESGFGFRDFCKRVLGEAMVPQATTGAGPPGGRMQNGPRTSTPRYAARGILCFHGAT